MAVSDELRILVSVVIALSSLIGVVMIHYLFRQSLKNIIRRRPLIRRRVMMFGDLGTFDILTPLVYVLWVVGLIICELLINLEFKKNNSHYYFIVYSVGGAVFFWVLQVWLFRFLYSQQNNQFNFANPTRNICSFLVIGEHGAGRSALLEKSFSVNPELVRTEHRSGFRIWVVQTDNDFIDVGHEYAIFYEWDGLQNFPLDNQALPPVLVDGELIENSNTFNSIIYIYDVSTEFEDHSEELSQCITFISGYYDVDVPVVFIGNKKDMGIISNREDTQIMQIPGHLNKQLKPISVRNATAEELYILIMGKIPEISV
eukprot:TRINITY_DN9526_c0_g1_i1.p1 TRINITY_DN9526_c0_g1~~TRINITY_DN9526_c0_g1_i1.p1  ORF type:complete len:315 (-),score=60.26 TRINITY_DN9526_c0_g1_i1:46-990(-)